MLPEDQKLIKFHGIYQQDDRDIRQSLVDKGVEELPPPKVLNGAELAAKELMSFKSIDQVGTYQFIN
jgi:hypothetical protein